MQKSTANELIAPEIRDAYAKCFGPFLFCMKYYALKKPLNFFSKHSFKKYPSLNEWGECDAIKNALENFLTFFRRTNG